MSTPEDIAGPVIVWEDFGYEGWQPTSYPTLANALATAGITRNHVVTRLINIENLLAAKMAEHPAADPETPKDQGEGT